jgi:flagellar biosynthesis/type III secretory pathway M-ring protein FliF/YscJ
MRRRSAPEVEASAPAALPAGQGAAPAQVPQAGSSVEQQLEAKLAEREAQQQKLDAQALSALKLAPAITKTSEVLAKHLREKVKEEPGLSAHVLQSWIREDGS